MSTPALPRAAPRLPVASGRRPGRGRGDWARIPNDPRALAYALADRLGRRSPSVALRVLELAAPMMPLPPRESLRALLPDLDAAGRLRVARGLRWQEMKSRAFGRLRRGGLSESLLPLVRCADRAGLRARAARGEPAILATFHVGPLAALGLGLRRLGVATLILRRTAPAWVRKEPGLHERTQGGLERPVAAFKRGVEHLRGGGTLLLALDGFGSPSASVPCLGRSIGFARGAFAMARLTGAPILPTVARGSQPGPEVELLVCEPLPTSLAGAGGPPFDHESALAREAGAWLERYLRESPQELRPRLMRLLLAAPRAT